MRAIELERLNAGKTSDFRRGVDKVLALLGCYNGIGWQLITDISRQPIGRVIKGKQC